MNEVSRKKGWQVSLAQIHKMLILFAARARVSTKLFSRRAKTHAPELVAEVFLNVELHLCCDRLKIVEHVIQRQDPNIVRSHILGLRSECQVESETGLTSRSEQHSIADYGTSRGTGTWYE